MGGSPAWLLNFCNDIIAWRDLRELVDSVGVSGRRAFPVVQHVIRIEIDEYRPIRECGLAFVLFAITIEVVPLQALDGTWRQTVTKIEVRGNFARIERDKLRSKRTEPARLQHFGDDVWPGGQSNKRVAAVGTGYRRRLAGIQQAVRVGIDKNCPASERRFVGLVPHAVGIQIVPLEAMDLARQRNPVGEIYFAGDLARQNLNKMRFARNLGHAIGA